MVFGKRILIGAALSAVIFGMAAHAQSQTPASSPISTADRQQYRDKLLQILPPDPSFDTWLKKTNALPPDFNSLPRHNSLPDPLAFLHSAVDALTKDDAVDPERIYMRRRFRMTIRTCWAWSHRVPVWWCSRSLTAMQRPRMWRLPLPRRSVSTLSTEPRASWQSTNHGTTTACPTRRRMTP